MYVLFSSFSLTFADLISSRRSFLPQMASYNYSSTNSEIHTPRSSSPSSTFSRSSSTTVSQRLSISRRRISEFNSMSAVDINAIESAMKMAQLDTLKGYAQKQQSTVRQESETLYLPAESCCGYQLIREPHLNKGIFARHQSYQHKRLISKQAHHLHPPIE